MIEQSACILIRPHCFSANDCQLLIKLPKVKCVRNDQREGKYIADVVNNPFSLIFLFKQYCFVLFVACPEMSVVFIAIILH